MNTEPFDYEHLPQVCRYQTDEVLAEIYTTPDGAALLVWTDYVASEWHETFPTVPIALARLACLTECERHAWGKGFAFQPEEFARYVFAFLEG